MIAGGTDDLHQVCLDLLGDAHGPHQVPDLQQPLPREHGLDGIERLRGLLVAVRDPPLTGRVRVADAGLEQEPVELGLGQGERALELHRVLGRHDEEGIREAVGRALDRDLALLHRLQQRGLRPRRRAVDLVHQQEVREHGAGDEPQAGGLEQAGARHVGREEVGRALDSRHPQVQAPGDGPGQQRLARARDVLEQDVPVREQRDGDQPQGLVRAHDGQGHRAAQVVPQPAADGDDVGAMCGCGCKVRGIGRHVVRLLGVCGVGRGSRQAYRGARSAGAIPSVLGDLRRPDDRRSEGPRAADASRPSSSAAGAYAGGIEGHRPATRRGV